MISDRWSVAGGQLSVDWARTLCYDKYDKCKGHTLISIIRNNYLLATDH